MVLLVIRVLVVLVVLFIIFVERYLIKKFYKNDLLQILV
jgi:hypothetical protein